MSDCAICQKPLGEPEIALNRQWHFECEKCELCGESLQGSSEQITKCLLERTKVAHPHCLKHHLFQDFRNNTIPITRAHINALNSEINKFFPTVNPNPEDIRILYDLLISLQETATNVSTVLGASKERLLVQESRKFDTEQRAKAQVEKQARIETEAERIAKQNKSAQMAAERENPALRHRRKAIEGIMKTLGFTEEQAIAMVDKQEGKIQ